MTTAQITIFVTVDDVSDLVEAARRRHMDETPTANRNNAREMVPDGDISAALRMLFDDDPGEFRIKSIRPTKPRRVDHA